MHAAFRYLTRRLFACCIFSGCLPFIWVQDGFIFFFFWLVGLYYRRIYGKRLSFILQIYSHQSHFHWSVLLRIWYVFISTRMSLLYYHRLNFTPRDFSEFSCVLLLVSSVWSTYLRVFTDVHWTSNSHCFIGFHLCWFSFFRFNCF